MNSDAAYQRELSAAEQQLRDVTRQRMELLQVGSNYAGRLQEKVEEITNNSSHSSNNNKEREIYLEGIVSTLEQQLHEANRRLLQRTEEVDALQNRLAEKEIEKTSVEASFLQFETELSSLRSELAESRYENGELKSKLVEATQALAESQALAAELGKTVAEFEQKKPTTTTTTSSPSPSSSSSPSTKKNNESEIEELKRQLAQMTQARDRAIQEARDLRNNNNSASSFSSPPKTNTSTTNVSSIYGWGSPSSPATATKVTEDMVKLHSSVDVLARLCDNMARIRTNGLQEGDLNAFVDGY